MSEVPGYVSIWNQWKVNNTYLKQAKIYLRYILSQYLTALENEALVSMKFSASG